MSGRPVRPELVAFALRLRQAASLLGQHADAARAAGVGVAQFRRYLSGRHMPSVEIVGRVAAAAGVRTEWLLSGDEPMRRDAGSDTFGIVDELLSSPSARARLEVERPGLVAMHDAAKAAFEVSFALQQAGLYEALADAGYPLDDELLSDIRALEGELAAPLRAVSHDRWPDVAAASVRAFRALLAYTRQRTRVSHDGG